MTATNVDGFFLTEIEVWRDIPGSAGYQASSAGRVRSVSRTVQHANGSSYSVRGTVLAPCVRRDGYLQVNINRKSVKVHKAIAMAFLGDSECSVLHRNGIATDNRPENLYYGTQSQNLRDAVRHGTHAGVRKTHCPYGHEFTPDNIYWTGRLGTSRRCKVCAKASAARSKARKREAAKR